MLLSSQVLSKGNTGLTLDTIKWIMNNVLVMDQEDIYQLKWHENADHPLMKEESLYDDLPVEIQGLFVMEPYFPRKYFNRAFAWLFGKESIEQIDAASFSHYEQFVDENPAYTLTGSWKHLPFTDDEYRHIYSEFSKLFDVNGSLAFSLCRIELMQNDRITPEIYRKELSEKFESPPLGVCAEIANEFADRRMARLSPNPHRNSLPDLLDLDDVVSLENLSQDRRNKLFSLFDVNEIQLYGVALIYGGKIPDDVYDELLASGAINAQSIMAEPSLISNMRLPAKEAERIAFLYPVECALEYFRRSDLTEELRVELLLKLVDEQEFNYMRGSINATYVLSQLIYTGTLTLSEIELLQDKYQNQNDFGRYIFDWSKKTGIELPSAMQDKWLGDEMNTTQMALYHDIPTLVDAIRDLYAKVTKPSKKFNTNWLSSVLLNPRWTTVQLFELIDITRKLPIAPGLVNSQFSLRQDIWNKLFSESFYPSLDKADLTGPHGRAEKLLAGLLESEAHLLSYFDINVIARSNLQLDYADSDVSLAASLANHPELNERIVAERLQMRVAQLSDAPSLTPSRLSRAI